MKKAYLIILLYLAGFLLLYPTVAEILMYDHHILENRLPDGFFWATIAIFISHWGLIVIGSILLRKFRHKNIHIFFGSFFIVCGLYWSYRAIDAYILLGRQGT